MSENIVQQAVEEEITQSYIDYSMSVIVSRALPDVRDGMKPVQRRILYAMYDLKLFHNAKFKKSAAVIGEVLGKYHPHGDSSVYEALVRMAQPFSLRYPLVDGQGNFGNIDGDGAAAMRYTEARLTKIAEEMLQDIDQETVEWRDNYDSSRREPVFLPTKFPNHLCNGTMGIAVGMATNMAPHNLTEIINATLHIIENPDSTVDDIMEHIKGPDFPTGGVIFDPENIKEVYKKGKGSITLRGKVHIEENKKGNSIITIYELPYQLNKSTFVSKIGELISTKKLEGIQDITDESNKESIKISITLRSGVEPDIVLTKLYKLTDLQTNFNLNNIILTEGGLQPRLQNIKDLLEEFAAFRRKIVYNRSLFQLNKAKDRLHILEGLQKAIDILDQVIETIRGSQTRPEAKEKLMNNFEFTDAQSDYILMLRLQTLVGLEIQKIEDEIGEKKNLIEYLTQIINEPKKLDEVVIDELIYMRDEYGDKRRTEVSNDYSIYQLDNSLKNIKRLEELQKEDVILRIGIDNTFKILYQSRLNNIPEDTLKLEYTHNQNKIIAITNKGEIVVEKLKELGSHNIKGQGVNITKDYKTKGDTVYVDSMTEDFDYLMFVTNKNNIKKVKKDLITSMKKFPTTIMGLEEDEEIIKVLKIKESQTVGVVSNKGHLLLFKESNARPTGKTAGGVKATTLEDDENLVDIFKVNDEQFFFIYSDDSGKMISMEDLKLQKRGQKGIKVAKLKNGEELKGGMALEDGQIKAQLEGGEVKDIQENSLKLKTKNTGLDKIVAGKIYKIYEYEKNKDDYKDE